MTSSVPFESGVAGPRRATLEELVRAKRLGPVRSVEELTAPATGVFESDDEVDEFVAAVREWRQADLG